MLNKISDLLARMQNLVKLHTFIFNPSDPMSSQKAAWKLLRFWQMPAGTDVSSVKKEKLD